MPDQYVSSLSTDPDLMLASSSTFLNPVAFGRSICQRLCSIPGQISQFWYISRRHQTRSYQSMPQKTVETFPILAVRLLSRQCSYMLCIGQDQRNLSF